MDLVLKRLQYRKEGIFGVLESKDGVLRLATIEHAYPDASTYLPKVPKGVYECVRGMHRLAHMSAPFETFEITGVPGHSNILFHVGNTQADSEGCVLLGTSQLGNSIVRSRIAFQDFMDAQKGAQTFKLQVE